MVDKVTAGAGEKKSGLTRAFHNWLFENAINLYLAIFTTLLLVALMAPRIFITIPPGHVGALWYRFGGGTVTERHLTEGMHMVWPWDRVYTYDARLHNDAREYDTISSDGLAMKVDIAVRYRINAQAVGALHQLVGPDYPEILVYPEIGSHARELIAQYTPEQLYTEARAFIQSQILQRMVTQVGSSLLAQSIHGRLVQIEDVLIRGVSLPATVRDAIERKAEQYHVMLEYDYRLMREDKERQRKEIEARGIKAFQEIVAQGITDDYLRLRGIEATFALSQSDNSKIVVIGAGKDGLPIILGGTGTAEAAAASGHTTGHGAALPNAMREFSVTTNAAMIEPPRPPNAAPVPGQGKAAQPQAKPAPQAAPADHIAKAAEPAATQPDQKAQPKAAPTPPADHPASKDMPAAPAATPATAPAPQAQAAPSGTGKH